MLKHIFKLKNRFIKVVLNIFFTKVNSFKLTFVV